MTDLYLELSGRVMVWMRANGNLVCGTCSEFYRDGKAHDPLGGFTQKKYGDRCVKCAGMLERCGRPAEDIRKVEAQAEMGNVWRREGSDPGNKFGERMWKQYFTEAGREARRQAIEKGQTAVIASGDEG